MAATPLLQARIITSPEHAQALIGHLASQARHLFGPHLTCRTHTRTARHSGYVRVYLTVTPKEEPPVGQP